ncbi:cilia- and flagella-associated protein 44 isoform X2 [Bradysia coprophila]|uniref:cilia- and flagella-associated protein 44 isoform X2 n=1 Tax=Bradysia coprophila TaxID=38358 RepID=UPI00187D768D|nr:cilia- and flagella-associated protein 44 isoform X2 [Bradysia coprophila]
MDDNLSNLSNLSNLTDNSNDIIESASNYIFDEKILNFQHSFGYDSKRLSNLCLISDSVLVFASGNLIHFFDIDTKKIRTRKTENDGGIGYITKNPNPIYNHIIIAENGPAAAIYIYKFPEMEMVSKCQQDDTVEYSCLDFNPDGSMMVSQTGPPKFFITIWNWKSSSIILNTKSTKNVVFRVMFSLFDPYQLTTCGQGHIQFWKISETFSGLKLKSQIGRFGKTTISDISAIFAMGNGHVLSGSEWGNILVWEEGLIKFEVCRKDRSTCHASGITQIAYKNGDVMTVGLDGYVRIWFWETVNNADPPDTDPFVPIEPTYEFRIGDEESCCSLMSLVRINPHENWWYAQDGNGGIWKCDLSLVNSPSSSERLFRCHSGKIIGIGVCPYQPIIATLGEDGRLHFYDYESKELMMWKQFHSNGRCLIWLDTDVDPSGRILILGFADGVIRVVAADLDQTDIAEPVRLIQAIKPHKSDVSRISMNNGKTLLISGSTDRTIFIFQIRKELPNVTLEPVGFIATPSGVTAFSWKPQSFATALAGCEHGDILQFEITETDLLHSSETYQLNGIKMIQTKFKSVKSQINRDRQLRRIKQRKAGKRLMKVRKLKDLRRANPDVRIDEATFLEDSESEEEVEPLHIPKVGNPVLWIRYTTSDTIWMTVGEYDCGYVYEYDINNSDPLHCIELKRAVEMEVNSFLQINDFLIFGMSNGSLRIHKIHQDFRNLTNFIEINMHDRMNGIINHIALSRDSQFLFTVGNDSNIFSYKNNIPGTQRVSSRKSAPSTSMESFAMVEDITDPLSLTLEEQRIKHNIDKVNQIADVNKAKMKKIIADYKVEFLDIVRRNALLKASMQLDLKTVNLDDRITADIQKRLDEEMELVERRKAYEVEKCKLLTKKVKDFYISPLQELPIELHGIKTNTTLKSFRVMKIRDELTTQKNPFDRDVGKEGKDGTLHEPKTSLTTVTDEDGIMIFLNEFESRNSELKFELQMKRLWEKYCHRKMDEKNKSIEWTNMTAVMPDLDKNDPEDIRALKMAESQIGDYKLKRFSVYVRNIDNRTTTSAKFQEILNVRTEIDSIRRNFNRRAFELRNAKEKLVSYAQVKLGELGEIHLLLQPHARKTISVIPQMVDDKEFPQKVFDELENFDRINPEPQAEDSKAAEKKIDFSVILSRVLDFQEISSNEEKSSWERELTQLKQIELEFRQNQIIKDVDSRIDQFDADLNELKQTRLQTETDLKLLEIRLISLNQELCIVKDFERIENHLIDQVETGEREYANVVQTMDDLNQEIVAHNRKIRTNIELMASISQQFSGSVANNKYTKFLSKVFKRKPPKERKNGDDEEDEDSSEDSSDSSDDDDISLNSKTDIGALYFDENVCPKDCDRNLYDLTMKLRSRRQSLELSNRSSQTEIETIKKTLTTLAKKLTDHEKQLAVYNGDLMACMKEKQSMINDVNHLVILRSHQLQHFTTKSELFAVDKSIVFDVSVFNKLFARVGELELETIESQRKHRVNIIHLARMNTDCRYMEGHICELNRDLQQAMVKKFGMSVNLDELQETILNRFAFMIRSNFEDIKKEYAKKADELKSVLSDKKTELQQHVLQVIEKLNILAVLEEDRNYINNVLQSQQKTEKLRSTRPPVNVKQDVAKLQEISQQQLQTIADLEKEIYTLRLKAKPFGTPNNDNPFANNINLHIDGYDDCNTKSSTSTTGMNNKLIISHLVANFFGCKSTTKEPRHAQSDIDHISQFLYDSIQSLNFDEMEQSIAALVESFQKRLPRNWYDKCSATQIALFIQDVFRKVHLHSYDDQTDFEPEELLYGIVQDVKDSISPTHPDYGQKFYTELFTNLLHNMRIEDLLNSDVLSVLMSILLQHVGTISVSGEMEKRIFSALTDSLLVASNDNVDVAALKQLTDYVFNAMRNKRR